jgi:hypothetical protein
MTWEQKLQACAALGPPVSLNMRMPGNWYAHQSGVWITNPHSSTGKYGNGKTPQEAAEDHFKCLTELDHEDECVKVEYCGQSRFVTWNGFMWSDYPEDRFARDGAMGQ